MNYIIVRRVESGDMSSDVERKLRDGWVLYGNPFVDQFHSFCQAMTKGTV